MPLSALGQRGRRDVQRHGARLGHRDAVDVHAGSQHERQAVEAEADDDLLSDEGAEVSRIELISHGAHVARVHRLAAEVVVDRRHRVEHVERHAAVGADLDVETIEERLEALPHVIRQHRRRRGRQIDRRRLGVGVDERVGAVVAEEHGGHHRVAAERRIGAVAGRIAALPIARQRPARATHLEIVDEVRGAHRHQHSVARTVGAFVAVGARVEVVALRAVHHRHRHAVEHHVADADVALIAAVRANLPRHDGLADAHAGHRAAYAVLATDRLRAAVLRHAAFAQAVAASLAIHA